MSPLDWAVLTGTLLFIIGYGTWRTRRAGQSLDGYLLGGRPLEWLVAGPVGWACLLLGLLLAAAGVLWIEGLARSAAAGG